MERQIAEEFKIESSGGNKCLPKPMLSDKFEYANYMELKILGMECYAALAGEGEELVVILKDIPPPFCSISKNKKVQLWEINKY